MLEITVKNRLFTLIKEALGEDWFFKQITAEKKDSVFEEEIAFILRRKPKQFFLKDNGLLVESGLGFWVEFFNKRLYKATKGLPISIFKHLPSDIKRKDIYKKLGNVKELRNKLFHSRIHPITNSNQLRYLDQLKDTNKELVCLLEWLEIPGYDNESNVELERLATQIRTSLQ